MAPVGLSSTRRWAAELVPDLRTAQWTQKSGHSVMRAAMYITAVSESVHASVECVVYMGSVGVVLGVGRILSTSERNRSMQYVSDLCLVTRRTGGDEKRLYRAM